MLDDMMLVEVDELQDNHSGDPHVPQAMSKVAVQDQDVKDSEYQEEVTLIHDSATYCLNTDS